MINGLARQLYSKTLELKGITVDDLRKSYIRAKLLIRLDEIKLDVNALLKELTGNACYSPEYYDLALFMQRSLLECISLLAIKDRNNNKTIRNCIHALHNLPRAFLSAEDRMRISVSEALDYYGSYEKNGR